MIKLIPALAVLAFLIAPVAAQASSPTIIKGSKSYQSRTIETTDSASAAPEQSTDETSPAKVEPAAGVSEDTTKANDTIKGDSVSKLQERMQLPRKN